MHSALEITNADIQKLNDGQARELVARLCKAELRAKGIGTHPVTWGGDQRARDGGVDIRVDITSHDTISGYIPKIATAYQVKAEKFPQGKISGEMAPAGILRPAIIELSEKLGAYIIVSTRDSCSDSSLRTRKNAMQDCLVEFDLANTVHIDFYDTQRLVDWVSNHLSVIIWLRDILGRPIQGWRSYGPWAYKEKSTEDEYLLDEKTKVFIPNTGKAISVTEAINHLRGELSKAKAAVRIVGLSGVGKTRLVQALFDNRIETVSNVLDQENVLYTDLSDNPTPQPTAMIESLLHENADGIVIIDNCGQDTHRRLTELIQTGKPRLVTIEYDIRDDLPDDTTCYRLDASSDKVISTLLERRYATLSTLDIDKIVAFSDGNARVAFALAGTSKKKGELAILRDDALFNRLFLQKHNTNDELQKCAEAASLLYSFDAEDVSENSELAILAFISEVTIPTFQRNITTLQRRGLVQERGKWRAVLPHAIANQLATRAIESYPRESLLERLVYNAPERVAQSFSRRLCYLHESRIVRDIADEWLRSDGFFGDVASLQGFKLEILKNIAPINQSAVLNALYRAAEKKEFVSISNENRSHFLHLLRSLAYEPDLFDKAVAIMLEFVLEEAHIPKNESSQDQDILQSLFYLCLSGTLATPEKRAEHVRLLAFSEDEIKQKLALVLLQASLEATHFSSSFDFDFGALRRTYGWEPESFEEYQNWYVIFVSLTVDMGKKKTPIGLDARKMLGEFFRGLWVEARLHGELTQAANELMAIDGWPDGWLGINETLHWEKKNLNEDSLSKLIALHQKLYPHDLRTKIQVKVLSAHIYDDSLDNAFEDTASISNFDQRACQKAEELGKAAAQNGMLLCDLGLYIFHEEHTGGRLSCFGNGVGQTYHDVAKLLYQIRELIVKTPNETVDFQFIGGLIEGWYQASPEGVANFLDSVVEDEVFGRFFLRMQLITNLDEASYSRLIKSLKIGLVPDTDYLYLGHGHDIDSLSVYQISSLLNLLANKSNGGLGTAIDILSMVIHYANSKDAMYKTDLANYCLEFIARLDWELIDAYNEGLARHLTKVIECALSIKNQHELIKGIVSSLIQQKQSNLSGPSRRIGNILLPFFKEYPKEALDVVFSFFKKTAKSTLQYILSVRFDRHQETVIKEVPVQALIDWCEVSPEDRCIFAAQTCGLFENKKTDDSEAETEIKISLAMRGILALAPNKKTVLRKLVLRFIPTTWSGSRAAIIRKGLELLDQLNLNGDLELNSLIEEEKQYLLRVISDEEQLEQARERSENRSFE